MDVVFLELFLFVCYYSIVHEKLVIQKIGNPNRIIVNEYTSSDKLRACSMNPKNEGRTGVDAGWQIGAKRSKK